MLFRWLPWRFLIRAFARGQGFVDPLSVLSAMRKFSHASEIDEPIELLRAGLVFHARGLINTKAIQHNLDWIWPYWVERQFNPKDASFIPRAFSITHVNLTHRNWTAAGIPCSDAYMLVDPRGLVTCHYDGWSLDFWVIRRNGRGLFPSRALQAGQRLDLQDGLGIETGISETGISLYSRVEVKELPEITGCIRVRAQSSEEGWLVAAVRPYNPEGISFINSIKAENAFQTWTVNGKETFCLSSPPQHALFSTYREGDVFEKVWAPRASAQNGVECEVGLATACALYPLAPGAISDLSIEVPLREEEKPAPGPRDSWQEVLASRCRLRVPDSRFVELFDAALTTLVLLSPHDVYPGSFTYKRFWFRDAAFMLHALLAANRAAEAKRAIPRFLKRQSGDGYFLSQEGEWDSNGEALWIMQRYFALTNESVPPSLRQAIEKGARWIEKKRLKRAEGLHAGLLPAGFSAEHFGPNDYYYWDDFWGTAGLRAAAWLLQKLGAHDQAQKFEGESEDLLRAAMSSIEHARMTNRRRAIPASPYRRMDAGAVGTLAASYPLELLPPDDAGIMATAEFLLEHCTFSGAFFQDMIHSGINAYLTLHLAQVLLRAGDPRFFALVRRVAELATPTGQWPEAIHPHSGGGCMGDGQHGWAAAEWVLMMRSMFVREENGSLVLASGIPAEWLKPPGVLSFGPSATSFGPVSVDVSIRAHEIEVSWSGDWYGAEPDVEVRLCGHEASHRRGEAHCIVFPGKV